MKDRGTLLLCVPNYRGVMIQEAHLSIARLMYHFGREGFPVVDQYEKSASCERARQVCVDTALGSADVEHLLFIDDDMVFSIDQFEALWNSYQDGGLNCLSALAFRNSMPTSPCIFGKLPNHKRWGHTEWWCIMSDYPGLPRQRYNKELNQYEMTEPNGKHRRFKVEATGFGMVLIKKSMLDKMRRDKDGKIIPHYRHFSCPKALSPHEDVAFCLNAIDKGFDIWCDSRVRIRHLTKDQPTIGEDTYIAQGDAVEFPPVPVPVRLQFQDDNTTETVALSPMEVMLQPEIEVVNGHDPEVVVESVV
jgi:hypothetical protein